MTVAIFDDKTSSLERIAFPFLRSKQIKTHLMVILLYLFASVVLFNSILIHGLGVSQPLTGGGDFGLSVLNMAWLPFAILHGKNIFYSNYQFALHGINMMGTPAYFTQALVMLPITLLFGPVVSTNIAIILGPVVTAFSSYIVYYKITKSRYGSILSGLVLGFSILVVNDSVYGHFHVTWIFGPPIIFYIYYLVVTKVEISVIKYGTWLGIICSLQFYGSTELITTTLFFYGIFGLFIAVLERRLVRDRLRRIVVVSCVGGLISILLCGYAIYFFLFGKDHVFFNNGRYSNPIFKLGVTDLFLPLDRLNLGLKLMSNNFSKVSIPIVVLATIVLLGRYLWRQKIARYCLMFCIFIYFCMIGPDLRIFPMQNLLPNPIYYLLMHTPVISNTLFVRYIYFFTFFCNFGFIIALKRLDQSLKHVVARPRRLFSIKYLIAGLLALNLFWMDSHYFANQQAIAPGGNLATGKYIPYGAIVSVYPKATIYNGDPLIYLAQSNFKYRITSGYGFESIRGIPSFFLLLSPIDNYLTLQLSGQSLVEPSTQQISNIKSYVAKNNIRCVIVANRFNNYRIFDALTLIFGKARIVDQNAVWCKLGS